MHAKEGSIVKVRRTNQTKKRPVQLSTGTYIIVYCWWNPALTIQPPFNTTSTEKRHCTSLHSTRSEPSRHPTGHSVCIYLRALSCIYIQVDSPQHKSWIRFSRHAPPLSLSRIITTSICCHYHHQLRSKHQDAVPQPDDGPCDRPPRNSHAFLQACPRRCKFKSLPLPTGLVPDLT